MPITSNRRRPEREKKKSVVAKLTWSKTGGREGRKSLICIGFAVPPLRPWPAGRKKKGIGGRIHQCHRRDRKEEKKERPARCALIAGFREKGGKKKRRKKKRNGKESRSQRTCRGRRKEKGGGREKSTSSFIRNWRGANQKEKKKGKKTRGRSITPRAQRKAVDAKGARKRTAVPRSRQRQRGGSSKDGTSDAVRQAAHRPAEVREKDKAARPRSASTQLKKDGREKGSMLLVSTPDANCALSR